VTEPPAYPSVMFLFACLSVTSHDKLFVCGALCNAAFSCSWLIAVLVWVGNMICYCYLS